MGKFTPATTLDQELNYLALCDYMTVVTGSSTSYSDMYSGSVLARQAMVGGDYSIAGATFAPRIMTISAKSGVAILTSGCATHVALIKTAGSVIGMITTCGGQQLTQSGTVDFPAWTITMNQAT